MKLTRKRYERPKTALFELKQQSQLWAGSNGDIPNSDSYTPGEDPFSFAPDFQGEQDQFSF